MSVEGLVSGNSTTLRVTYEDRYDNLQDLTGLTPLLILTFNEETSVQVTATADPDQVANKGVATYELLPSQTQESGTAADGELSVEPLIKDGAGKFYSDYKVHRFPVRKHAIEPS